VRNEIRYRHYSYRTEQSYIDWIVRFFIFFRNQSPDKLGSFELRQYLGYLADVRKVAASTQN
jgi:hypothetical protein